MKYLFLSASILFTSFSVAQNIDYKKKYESAMILLNSEYAKKLFPEKKVYVEIINNIPDTIYINDKQTFRLLQYVQKSKNGIFDIKRTDQLFSFTIKDNELSYNEMILLNACNNEKPFVIKNTSSETSFTPTPINIFPKTNEGSKVIFNNTFKEGFNLNLFSRIKFFFEDTKTGGDNWLSYYQDSIEKKEFAISYIIVRNYDAFEKSNYKNKNLPYKNFIHRIKSISYNSSDPKKLRTIVKNLLLKYQRKNLFGEVMLESTINEL